MPRGRKEKPRNDYYSQVVSAPEAAAFLKLPERTFNRLVENGVIPKNDYGEYILGEVVESYWRNQFDTEGLKAAQTRLTTAQAEIKELELAEMRGEMHRASVIQKIWAERNVNIKSRLLAIPSKIAPELIGQDLPGVMAKLKDAICEVLNELAEYDAGQITSATLLAN